MIYILAAIALTGLALSGLGFVAFMTGIFGVIYIIVWQPWVKVAAVSRPVLSSADKIGESQS